MNEVDRVVRASVFRLLVAGSREVTPSEVAASTGVTVGSVTRSFGRLADAHRLVLGDDRGRVVMAHPFSAVPTGYRAEVGERSRGRIVRGMPSEYSHYSVTAGW
jgi:hypothetical protein